MILALAVPARNIKSATESMPPRRLPPPQLHTEQHYNSLTWGPGPWFHSRIFHIFAKYTVLNMYSELFSKLGKNNLSI